MVEAVHQLHLPQHVGSIAAQLVHLQGHHLVRHPVVHLKQKKRSGEMLLFSSRLTIHSRNHRRSVESHSLFFNGSGGSEMRSE